MLAEMERPSSAGKRSGSGTAPTVANEREQVHAECSASAYLSQPEAAQQAPGRAESGGFLGNTAKSPTPPTFGAFLAPAAAALAYPEGPAAARLERWALQSVAREILPKSRLSACFRNRVKGAPAVGVKYSKSRARASYCNLQTCASVWACPICSAKISEYRRADLVKLVAAHRAAGGTVLLVTRTFPHYRTDRLEDLLSGLKVAEDKYRSGAPWQRLKERFGIVGTVRAIECTYGNNGWHPHIHELVFIAAQSPECGGFGALGGPQNCSCLDLQLELMEDLRASLYKRWTSACLRAGLPEPSEEHGVDVRDGSYAASYAAKWGIESELTKWHVKHGKAESITPFDLLRIALQSDCSKSTSSARTLFREYAESFKSRRQLVYSPGLRALYDLDPEVSDEEASAGEEPDAVLLGHLEPHHWKAILRAGLRGQLLEAINAAGGAWDAVDEVIGEAMAKYVPPRFGGAPGPDCPF
jgi:hypothetical protein